MSILESLVRNEWEKDAGRHVAIREPRLEPPAARSRSHLHALCHVFRRRVKNRPLNGRSQGGGGITEWAVHIILFYGKGPSIRHAEWTVQIDVSHISKDCVGLRSLLRPCCDATDRGEEPLDRFSSVGLRFQETGTAMNISCRPSASAGGASSATLRRPSNEARLRVAQVPAEPGATPRGKRRRCRCPPSPRRTARLRGAG